VTDPAPPDEVMADAPVGGRRFSRVVAAVVAVVVVALVAVLATRAPSGERQTRSRLLGRIAPATAGRTLDGGSVDIDDFRGRWVMVNFFASWCTPCISEHPELKAFAEEHQGKGDAVLIGVTFDNKPADARAFFAKRGGAWPVIDDPENSIAVSYGMAQVPETFVVAPNGTVVQRFAGEVTREDLDDVIDEFERGGAG
jgi:cytochrome c biogenesis protein CcmG/thiol:disulfide interchange protein DsbE